MLQPEMTLTVELKRYWRLQVLQGAAEPLACRSVEVAGKGKLRCW